MIIYYINYKYLLSIQKGNKLLCNTDNNVTIDNSYIPAVSRWYYSEDRNVTIELIKSTINDVYSITDTIFRNEVALQKNDKEKEMRTNSVNNFFKYSNQEILKKILLVSSSSLKGLQNLRSTYQDDIQITTELDIQINKLQSRISKLDHSFTNNYLKYKKYNYVMNKESSLEKPILNSELTEEKLNTFNIQNEEYYVNINNKVKKY